MEKYLHHFKKTVLIPNTELTQKTDDAKLYHLCFNAGRVVAGCRCFLEK